MLALSAVLLWNTPVMTVYAEEQPEPADEIQETTEEVTEAVPETEVQDIDNQSDWELAEIKYKYMKEKEK